MCFYKTFTERYVKNKGSVNSLKLLNKNYFDVEDVLSFTLKDTLQMTP